MRALAVGCMGFLVWTLAACSSSELRDVRIHVSVSDDQGNAQAGAPIEIDGIALAATDATGTSSITLEARASRARIAVRCAQGFHSPEPRSVPLSRHGRQPPLELTFVCRPTLRSLLLVVRAPLGEGLPVLADGQRVGTVGADGTLHAVLKRAPDQDLRLSLDTSGSPGLAPQHPAREVTVGSQDEIVVFDQGFSLAPKPRRASAVSRPNLPEPKHIPYAIGGNRY